MWDSDTLAQEATGLPGAVEAITGRVDINPPLYYEMRLKRVTSHSPMSLEDYDDAAVASDRLGKTDSAIHWMALKKSVLDKNNDPQHRYRYHANLGTFLAHKWLKSPDKTKTGLLDDSIAEIQAALALNRDAHFGREIVQLNLLKLIREDIESTGEPTRQSITEWEDMVIRTGKAKVSEGLVGLIVLGSAFESIDVVRLVSGLDPRDASVSTMANYRVKELEVAGRKAILSDGLLDAVSTPDGRPVDMQSLTTAWKELRQQGKEYQRNRTDFMLAQLKSGKHPDTDPEFWKGYVETPKPDYEKYQSPRRFTNNPNFWASLIPYGAGVCILIAIGAYVQSNRRGRQRALRK